MTWTARLIHYQDIRLGFPCLSIFSVRFVVASNPPAALLHWRAETPLRLLPGERAEQSCKLEQPTRVSGARSITSARGASLPGDALRLGIRDARGRELVPSVPVSRPISDNGWTFFRSPALDLTPGRYFLRVEVSPSAPPRGLNVWIVDSVDSYPDGSFVVDGESVGDAAFGLPGERLDLNSRVWDRRTVDKAVVYENIDAAPGAFYSQSLNLAEVEEVAVDGVTPLHFSPEQVTYRPSAQVSGWFVRSARVWPGWRVS